MSAAPLPTELETQVETAACAFTCGNICYQESHIQSALNKGYSLHQDGDDISQSSSFFLPSRPIATESASQLSQLHPSPHHSPP